MAIYLYVNTGSVNHGCEAIVRSTCAILNKEQENSRKILISTNEEEDRRFGLDNLAEILSCGHWSNNLEQVLYYIARKATGKSKLGIEKLYQSFLTRVCKDDVAMCIGGDTYCYTYPEYLEVCLDNINKLGAKSVLWGTSIEPSAMSERLICHLKKYDYIVAREGITYSALISKGISPERTFKTCDPAFHLPVKKTKLPYGFDKENTVGLNISGFVTGEDTDKTQKAFETVLAWLQDILLNTNYKVCLVPHVYGKEAYGKDDLYYAEKLYGEVPEAMKSRVSIIEEELSCTQLKYIISHCRFFIGARTHSMIAAYSTGVPAIALGYSVKADGIAKDLFGTTENYVLNIDSLQNSDNLKKAFAHLTANEDWIRKQYEKILPMYKDSIMQAAKVIMKDKESTDSNEI